MSSKLQAVRDWATVKQDEFLARNPEVWEARVNAVAIKLGDDLSPREIWKWWHFDMTGGKFPDGSTRPSEANVRADMDAAVAKLESALGRKATPEEVLNAYFAAQEKAKAAGFTPVKKKVGSRANALNDISVEELTKRFPGVAATAEAWHAMPVSKRLQYADVLVSEREAAVKQSTPVHGDTPEARLARAWGN